MSTTDTSPTETAGQVSVRAVAMPSEHGGWGLTLEPGLLGLLVAPSISGLCLALAAMVAFTSRTPLKIAAVDLRRGRRLPRTRLAATVGVVEVVVLAGLVLGAVLSAEGAFWLPLVVAAPLIAVEVAYEIRSRGRRLVPELTGATGVCSVAAMIVLADGGSYGLAAGVWLVLAARVLTSIPYVRSQIARIHQRPINSSEQWLLDSAAVVTALAAVWAYRGLALGAVAVVIVIGTQRMAAQRPLPRPAVIGITQMILGFGVVIFAAVGVNASF